MSIVDTFKTLLKPNQQGAPTTAPVATKTKVLVVEDDKAMRDVYVEVLLSEGFDVRIANNGEEGLSVATNYPPDIIVLDLLMPVMDGKTMLRKLRDIPQFKSLPVIVLTNQGDVDSMNETKLFGNASDFLIKANITPNILVDKIKMFSTPQ